MRFVRTAESIWGLPLGFTRVEYLESSGAQYIDTGFKPNPKTTRFELSYSTTRSTSTFPFGSRVNSSFPSTASCTSYISDTSVRADWAGSNSVAFSTTSGKINNLICENNKMTLNGSDYQGTADKSSSYLDYNFLLFNMWDGSSGVRATGFVGKFYKAKLWDNGTLIRDFIPCIDPLGVACMYDLVGKKAYYNQGTGEFTVGRQIIPVNYLESTGTQYIDTMIKSGVNMSVKAKFNLLDVSAKAVFGSYSGLNNNGVGVFFGTAGGNLSGKVYCNNTNVAVSPDLTLSTNTDYEIEMSGTTLVVNGSTYTSATTADNNYNMLLFARSNNGTVERQIAGKIYYFTIKDNGTLVRDFIPCKDENNVGFMFDTVSGTVYLNAGTGAFSVGENKYTSKLRLIKEAVLLPDGYKRVEYLQSTGTQYIDTEYTINTTTDEVLFNFQMISTTLYQWIMGEHDNGARFGVGVGDGANKRNIAYGSTTYKVNDTEIYNSIHYFKANSNGVYLNGTQVHGFETFSSSSTIYLFKLNLSGSNGAAGKIWRYVQKRNGVLIRDMIPCLDPNNTPCMFDLVEGKPYYNQGNGSFTYGHIITPVKYIESTGTQYIDTGIKLNNNSSVELYYQLTQAVQNRKGLFGGLGSNASKRFGALLSPSNSQLESGYGSGNEFYQLGLPDTNIHIIKQEKNLLYFDGSLVYTFNTATFAHDFNSPLGNFNYTNYNPASAKYYRSKWWDNGTLVRSFIPVRDENNVGYMFDEVTGQLFGNVGSGSFGIGNDLPKPKVRFIQDVLPREYRPLKYLESTGTQWIDTGVNPENSNTKQVDIETNFAILTPGSDQYIGIFGAAVPRFGFYTRYNNMCFGYYQASDNLYEIEYGKKYNLRFNVTKGSQNATLDGVTVWTETRSGTLANTYTIGLFCRNYSTPQWRNNARIYNLTIAIDGTFVRDFYPALRKSDNKPGMYDRITKQFFTNAAESGNDFNYE